jgi:exopolyphosphatase/guanosine-5'-triphosphate,3'-diphosphate pyrophosphatase
MPGFTDRERLVIAALCRYHRKAMPNGEHSALQGLTPDEKRAVLLTIPILRLADNLDRSHEQRIKAVECKLKEGGDVVLELHADGKVELEEWGAERAAETFREIYGKGISIATSKAVSGSTYR